MARTSDRTTGLAHFGLFNVPFKIPGLSSSVMHHSLNRQAGHAHARWLSALGKLLVGGVKFIVGILPAIVYARRECEEVFHQRLRDAQRRLKRGEIDVQAFAAVEHQVTASLRVLRRDE